MRTFDEINYQEYFGTMELSKRQKQERIKAATEFEDIFLLYITMIALDQEYPGNSVAQQTFIDSYTKAVTNYIDDPEFVETYVILLAALIEETTLRHIGNTAQIDPEKDNAPDIIEALGENYFTSPYRAKVLAANEANTVLNQSDFNDAKILGFTKKRWITEKDNRVRHTHVEVDDLVIPIDELFIVGNAAMRYPHDFEYGGDFPEELANCRCSVEYIR